MAMSLRERVLKGRHIYVRNMTTDPPTMVVLSFKTPGRDKQVVHIPPGPYPFEIYPTKVSKQAILEGSEQLNHFLENGRLKLVSSKKARKILEDPDVQAEVKAAMSRANSPAEQTRWAKEQKRLMDGQGGEVESKDDYVRGPSGKPKVEMTPDNPLAALLKAQQGGDNAPSMANYQLAEAGGDTDVHPKVLGLMASYVKDQDAAILRNLKAIRSQISSKDLHLIATRADKGSDTWKWANRQLKVF